MAADNWGEVQGVLSGHQRALASWPGWFLRLRLRARRRHGPDGRNPEGSAPAHGRDSLRRHSDAGGSRRRCLADATIPRQPKRSTSGSSGKAKARWSRNVSTRSTSPESKAGDEDQAQARRHRGRRRDGLRRRSGRTRTTAPARLHRIRAIPRRRTRFARLSRGGYDDPTARWIWEHQDELLGRVIEISHFGKAEGFRHPQWMRLRDLVTSHRRNASGADTTRTSSTATPEVLTTPAASRSSNQNSIQGDTR